MLWGCAVSDVTRILSQIEQGNGKAADEPLPLIYDKFLKLAPTQRPLDRRDFGSFSIFLPRTCLRLEIFFGSSDKEGVMPPDSEHGTDDLLDRIRRGDEAAEGELLRHFRDRLRRMVAARMDDRLTPRIDPSDVVQEALVVAHSRLAEYLQEADSPFYPWLRQITWERLVEAHRQHIGTNKRSVRKEVSMQLSDGSVIYLAERLTSSETGPSRQLVRKELRERIRRILSELPDMDREILILKHLEELTNSEAAAVLGITVVAAKKRYLRALGRVRKLMDKEV
jgi:RNA polymerase sigma-70 factor (ECF subfamily)